MQLEREGIFMEDTAWYTFVATVNSNLMYQIQILCGIVECCGFIPLSLTEKCVCDN